MEIVSPQHRFLSRNFSGFLSKAIYHKDIRECGSKNPVFTNFKRTFGKKWAWLVLMLDLTKATVVVGLFAWLFQRHLDEYQFGAAYTGMFCMLGHAYPCQYKFKGGKGFLVCLSAMWVVDWRVGLTSTIIMVILLLTTKYMSLSTVLAMLLCPILLIFFRCINTRNPNMRHKENFKRLRTGTESKFKVKSH